jgi:hypothetical protein
MKTENGISIHQRINILNNETKRSFTFFVKDLFFNGNFILNMSQKFYFYHSERLDFSFHIRNFDRNLIAMTDPIEPKLNAPIVPQAI